MKLLHHPESELSRVLLASLPEGVEVVDTVDNMAIGAYPSVIIQVPTYKEKRQAFNDAGELIGIEEFIVSKHEEVLRMPASWDVVNSVIAHYNYLASQTIDNPVKEMPNGNNVDN